MRKKLTVCGSSDFASTITAWGEITIPKMPHLSVTNVTVNTRKGVFVDYALVRITG